jgi:hypothetical protein
LKKLMPMQHHYLWRVLISAVLLLALVAISLLQAVTADLLAADALLPAIEARIRFVLSQIRLYPHAPPLPTPPGDG